MSFSSSELQIRANGVVYTIDPHSSHTDFRVTVTDSGELVSDSYLLGYLFEIVKGLDLAERMYERSLPSSTAQFSQDSIAALASLYAVEGTANAITSATGALIGGWASGGTVAIGVSGQLFSIGIDALRGSAAVTEPALYLTLARALYEATDPIYRSLSTSDIIGADQVEQLVDSLMAQHQLNLRVGGIISNDELLNRSLVGDAVNFTTTLFSGFIGVFGQTSAYLNAAPFAGSLLRNVELFEDVASLLQGVTSINQVISAFYSSQSLSQYAYFTHEQISSAQDLFDGIAPELSQYVTATWGDTAVTVVTQGGGTFVASQQANIVISEIGGANIDLSASSGSNEVSVFTSVGLGNTVYGGSGQDRVTITADSAVQDWGFWFGNSVHGRVGHTATLDQMDIMLSEDTTRVLFDITTGGFSNRPAFTELRDIDDLSLIGGDGNDLLVVWGENVRAIGNGGSNTLYADWSGRTEDLTWDLHDTEDTEATLANGWTVQGIDRLLARLGDGDNHITLNGGGNHIIGGAGNNTIVSGGAGETFDGGAGINDLSYERSDAGINIDLGTGRGLGGYAQGDVVSNIASVIGSGYDDTVRGNDQDNLLRGGAGDDQIIAGTGADYLLGDSGNDSITLIGTAYHTARYVAYNVSSDTQTGTGQRISLDGKVKIEAVIDGGSDINTIYLGDEGDAFFLHDAYSGFHHSLTLAPDYIGNDSMQRFINIQSIYGLDGDDIIDLTSPDYSLAGASIMIDGGEGNDVIWGSDANELIYGGIGDDTMFGGTGTDVLFGGSGADVFEFTKTSSDTTITDFDPGEGDLLRFYSRGGAQFDRGSIALTDDGIRIVYSEAGTRYEIDIALAASAAEFDLSLQQVLSATEFW